MKLRSLRFAPLLVFGVTLAMMFMPHAAHAEGINIDFGAEGDLTSSLKLFLMVAVLSMAPSAFIMLTCFTQVVIVLGLTRQSIGTTTLPPNQVMMGLALFITLFLMSPVISDVYNEAYKPYDEGKMTTIEAFQAAEKPIKAFMIKNTYDGDLKTFLNLRQDPTPATEDDVNILAAIPAYAVSQITKGLMTGLMIMIGFVILDIIVASVLQFLGLMFLPPQMISLPVKLLIFLMVGGFNQVVDILFNSIKT